MSGSVVDHITQLKNLVNLLTPIKEEIDATFNLLTQVSFGKYQHF